MLGKRYVSEVRYHSPKDIGNINVEIRMMNNKLKILICYMLTCNLIHLRYESHYSTDLQRHCAPAKLLVCFFFFFGLSNGWKIPSTSWQPKSLTLCSWRVQWCSLTWSHSPGWYLEGCWDLHWSGPGCASWPPLSGSRTALAPRRTSARGPQQTTADRMDETQFIAGTTMTEKRCNAHNDYLVCRRLMVDREQSSDDDVAWDVR